MQQCTQLLHFPISLAFSNTDNMTIFYGWFWSRVIEISSLQHVRPLKVWPSTSCTDEIELKTFTRWISRRQLVRRYRFAVASVSFRMSSLVTSQLLLLASRLLSHVCLLTSLWFSVLYLNVSTCCRLCPSCNKGSCYRIINWSYSLPPPPLMLSLIAPTTPDNGTYILQFERRRKGVTLEFQTIDEHWITRTSHAI
jgi:hypothetical protein